MKQVLFRKSNLAALSAEILGEAREIPFYSRFDDFGYTEILNLASAAPLANWYVNGYPPEGTRVGFGSLGSGALVQTDGNGNINISMQSVPRMQGDYSLSVPATGIPTLRFAIENNGTNTDVGFTIWIGAGSQTADYVYSAGTSNPSESVEIDLSLFRGKENVGLVLSVESLTATPITGNVTWGKPLLVNRNDVE